MVLGLGTLTVTILNDQIFAYHPVANIDPERHRLLKTPNDFSGTQRQRLGLTARRSSD